MKHANKSQQVVFNGKKFIDGMSTALDLGATRHRGSILTTTIRTGYADPVKADGRATLSDWIIVGECLVEAAQKFAATETDGQK
ncbi:MAG: hypothetical protein C4575_09445 [Desulforudis sp.]|jgi:hypothetical protein|nr:MAG: hypothetical protein C4575_09445 [Desulforudis sp.]